MRDPQSDALPQAFIVRPHTERVRVLDLSPSSVHIEHRMHLHPGTVCTLELSASAGSRNRIGKVIRCNSLLGGRLPFWYESEIEFSDGRN